MHTSARKTRSGVQVGAASALLFCAVSAHAFTFTDVVARARDLAARPYRLPAEVPRVIGEIGYDQHRGIRFRAEHALWSANRSRFRVHPVMPGNVYRRTVVINEVDAAGVRQMPFRKDHFSYDEPELASRVPDDLGFAGFELSYPIDQPDVQSKFLVFAGASYFRGVGQGDQFGLSMRGAAIDAGLASGEEFPDFVEFWLIKPPPKAKRLTLYALLDSPRLAGAYEFQIEPGAPTSIDVKAALYTRARIEILGVAPLTSMYFHGENSPRPPGAWRPEVHDSDGLSIQDATGEWIWQPLVNPARITIQSFMATRTVAFGLLQRDTQFASYEDPGARYHRRPSAAVELGQGLDGGRVVLVQLPTKNEFMDNIVAFWSPLQAVEGGTRLDFTYRLNLGNAALAGLVSLPRREPHGRIVRTFVGRDVGASDNLRFTIDFEGGPLRAMTEEKAALTAEISSPPEVAVIEHHLERLEAAGAWRLSILARAPADQSLILRAALRLHGQRVTEVWNYELEPGNEQRRALN